MLEPIHFKDGSVWWKCTNCGFKSVDVVSECPRCCVEHRKEDKKVVL